MKIYICSGVESRKAALEKHLNERCPELEQVWQSGYAPDHPFVKWIHACVAPHVDIKALSGYVKYLEIFQNILDTNQEYSFVVNDDVVFHKDWKRIFAETPKHYINILSLGVNYGVHPDTGYTVTGNVGGCECIGVTRQFVEFFMSSLDFEQAIDIVISSMMIHVFNLPLGISPMCQQTSILTTSSSTGQSNYKLSWLEYVKKPYTPTGLSYDILKVEYEKFMAKKKKVDLDFKERFGMDVDIWNIEYILKRYMTLINT